MFTPPPSPMPVPASAEESSLPLLPLTKPEHESEYPVTCVPSPSPMSPSTAEAGPSRIPLDVKMRSGRRTLLLVTLLPAALILSASLRHFMCIRDPVVRDEPTQIPYAKREPQLITTAGSHTLSSSGSQSSSSLLSQSSAPTPTSLPAVPSTAILPTPFPQPFDASLSENFTTQGCRAFFANFTQEENFRQCRSFAFLLNSSAAFLQAQRNLTLMNAIIWGTCNTPPTSQACDSTMSDYLSQLNSVCQSDINDENPVVLQARIGFQSYTAMRAAACLPDPTTNAFCYIDAVAADPPADIYFYALPLGIPVPTTTKPSCSPCVKSVLAVYAQFVNPHSGSGAVQIGADTGNSSATAIQATPLPALSKSYPPAARLAVNQCGGTYASVGVAQPNGAEHRRIAWAAVLLGLFLVGWIS